MLTTEPQLVTQGDTFTWRKTLNQYPATDGWVLNYALINSSGKIVFSAIADAGDHLVNVPAATTAGYARGVYNWQSYVTRAATGERYTVSVGQIEIVADFSAQAGGADLRTEARKILDTLQAAWLVASQSRAFVAEYTIGTRRIKMATRQEWVIEIDYWRRIVAKEDQAERLKRGLPSRRKVMVRF